MSDTPPTVPAPDYERPDPSPDWYGQKEKRKRAAEDSRRMFKVYIAGVLTVFLVFACILLVVWPNLNRVPVTQVLRPSIEPPPILRTVWAFATPDPLLTQFSTLPRFGESTIIATVQAANLPGLIYYTAVHGDVTEAFRVKPDGTAQQSLLTDDSPGARLFQSGFHWLFWSPDGKQALLRNLENNASAAYLYAISADGVQMHRFSNESATWDFGWTWSPDGSRILISGLKMLDGTGHITNLIEGTQPSWSADGRQIVFVRGSMIYLANSDGTQEQPVTRGASPALSPDGKWIAFDSATYDDHQVTTSDVAITNLTGTETRVITKTHSGVDLPRWSPDGRYLVYTALNGVPGPREVRITTVDGTLDWRVADGVNPYWIP